MILTNKETGEEYEAVKCSEHSASAYVLTLVPKRWMAKEGNLYWSIIGDMKPTEFMATKYESTEELYKLGNYFKTKEQAQAVADVFKAVLEYVHEPQHDKFNALVTLIDQAQEIVRGES